MGGWGTVVSNLQKCRHGILRVMEVEWFVELWLLASHRVIVIGVHVVFVGHVIHVTMRTNVIIAMRAIALLVMGGINLQLCGCFRGHTSRPRPANHLRGVVCLGCSSKEKASNVGAVETSSMATQGREELVEASLKVII